LRKNRISQTVPKVPIKKSDFEEKSDFSNRAQGAHQEIRFWGKIGFLKPCPMCPRDPILGKNRISQTVPKVPKKFFGKIGFLLKSSGLEISAFVY
jgi:hypothetical protein